MRHLTNLIKHTCDVINLLYYEHRTNKRKYFYVLGLRGGDWAFPVPLIRGHEFRTNTFFCFLSKTPFPINPLV